MSIYQSKDLDACAEAFKALSNPNRLAIFLHLISCCPPGTSCSFDEEMRRCVGDLGRGLSIGQPTISHHIKELHRAGLIHVQKKGKFTQCWVDSATVNLLADLLGGRLPIDELGAGFLQGSNVQSQGEEERQFPILRNIARPK